MKRNRREVELDSDCEESGQALGTSGRPARFVGLALPVGAAFSGCHHGVPESWGDASRDLCRLEDDLRGNGLVTIKRPGVWTENRLYPYRRECEEVFRNTSDLKKFKPELSASESAARTQRLGMCLDAAIQVERARAGKGPGLGQFPALAFPENAKPGSSRGQDAFIKPIQSGAKAFVANQTGLDPGMSAGLIGDDEDSQNGEISGQSGTGEKGTKRSLRSKNESANSLSADGKEGDGTKDTKNGDTPPAGSGRSDPPPGDPGTGGTPADAFVTSSYSR